MKEKQNNIKQENINFINSLGSINFTTHLIGQIIKTILKSYSNLIYKSHSISTMLENYYEISVNLKRKQKNVNFDDIDELQKQLLQILKKSLNISCTLFINIKND